MSKCVCGVLVFLMIAVQSGCSPQENFPVVITVPKSHLGEVRLVLDEVGGLVVEPTNGKYRYSIPESGELRVASCEPFQDWHEQDFWFEDGVRIPCEYEISDSVVGKAEQTWVYGGSTVQRNDGPLTLTYFIGTGDAYNAYDPWSDSE